MVSKVKSMRKYGIVQGRLSAVPQGMLQCFPQETWQEEFEACREIGLEFIELLSERQFNEFNPLWSEGGRNEITNTVTKNQLEIYSICSDFIIDHNLFSSDSELVDSHMEIFFEVCAGLEVPKIILPLLEESSVSVGHFDAAAEKLRKICDAAEQFNAEIVVETLLPANDLLDLIKICNRTNLGAVFDSGNRVNFKEHIYDEVCTLGDYISHVHIKDKNDVGENVLLGTGNVDFAELFSGLRDVNYKSAYVFETTRGRDPLETAIYNVTLCEFFRKEVEFE